MEAPPVVTARLIAAVTAHLAVTVRLAVIVRHAVIVRLAVIVHLIAGAAPLSEQCAWIR